MVGPRCRPRSAQAILEETEAPRAGQGPRRATTRQVEKRAERLDREFAAALAESKRIPPEVRKLAAALDSLALDARVLAADGWDRKLAQLSRVLSALHVAILFDKESRFMPPSSPPGSRCGATGVSRRSHAPRREPSASPRSCAWRGGTRGCRHDGRGARAPGARPARAAVALARREGRRRRGAYDHRDVPAGDRAAGGKPANTRARRGADTVTSSCPAGAREVRRVAAP